MTLDHKFGSNCDQSFPRPHWWAGGAMAPALFVVGLVIMGTTAIAARTAIVSIAPAAAALYAMAGAPVNLREISITDVRATITQQSEGQGELLVTGEIGNLRNSETHTPALRLALRGADGRELYAWTVRGPKTSLGARERVPFRARLAAPPSGVHDVLVKFSSPGDKGFFTESPS
jgi:hypothetical protein